MLCPFPKGIRQDGLASRTTQQKAKCRCHLKTQQVWRIREAKTRMNARDLIKQQLIDTIGIFELQSTVEDGEDTYRVYVEETLKNYDQVISDLL